MSEMRPSSAVGKVRLTHFCNAGQSSGFYLFPVSELGQQGKCSDVPRTNNCKMPVIERGDLGGIEAFSDRNNRRVHSAESEIGILLNQLCCTDEVGVNHVFDVQPTGNEGAEKGTLYGCLGTLGK